MSTHFAILSDLTNSPKEVAVLNLSSDVPGAVVFTVYPPVQNPVSSAPLPLNADQFASSGDSTIPNLFTPSGGAACLVQADFLPGPSFATLVQRSGTTKLLLTVAQDQQLANKVRAAVGDIGQGTNILIGNPSATQIVVTPRFGATSNLPGPSVTIAPRGVGKIPITTPNTHVTVFSEPEGNGPPIVAILAIDTGKVDETYLV